MAVLRIQAALIAAFCFISQSSIQAQSELESLDQSLIIDGINAYLEQKSINFSEYEKNYVTTVRESISEGLCVSFVAFWLCGKKNLYAKQAITKPFKAFKEKCELLINWKKHYPFTNNQIKTIDTFIENLLGFYGISLSPFYESTWECLASYNAHTYLLEFILGKECKKHKAKYDFVSHNGYNDLATYLKKKTKKDRMVFIEISNNESTIPGHALGLYVTPDKKYCFYDPNNLDTSLLSHKTLSLDQISDYIWKHYGRLYSNESGFMNINLLMCK